MTPRTRGPQYDSAFTDDIHEPQAEHHSRSPRLASFADPLSTAFQEALSRMGEHVGAVPVATLAGFVRWNPMSVPGGRIAPNPADAYSERFELERTERCWRDNCRVVSDPESKTGLCVEHRTELAGRWKS